MYIKFAEFVILSVMILITEQRCNQYIKLQQCLLPGLAINVS